MKTIRKKCKVVMLPTEDISSIFKWGDNFHVDCLSQSKVDTKASHQYLYIVSKDEIKRGDYFIVEDAIEKCIFRQGNIITLEGKWGLSYHKKHCKKIIATNNKLIQDSKIGISNTLDDDIYLPNIPKEFIYQYCKLGGIKKVWVEYWVKKDCNCLATTIEGCSQCISHELRLRPDNTIYIKSKKI